jgi:hypothetical protein
LVLRLFRLGLRTEVQMRVADQAEGIPSGQLAEMLVLMDLRVNMSVRDVTYVHVRAAYEDTCL